MDVQNLYAHSAQRISQGERVKGGGPATSRRCCRSSSSTTTPTAHTDRLTSTRPPAALPRPPARSSVPYDATGSAAWCTSTCTSHDMTGFSAPTPVGMRGHAQDVQEAVADLECEQDVESPQRHRAVDVEEVDREHAACVRRNCRQLVSVRRTGAGGIRCCFRIRRIVEAPTRWPSLSSSPWILLYPQFGFSVAIRTTSAASMSSIGGRPGRFG